MKRVAQFLKETNEFNGNLVRRLPAFLEIIASHWEFGDVSTRAAYDAFGHEVILCANSQFMWKDAPRNDIWWRAFNKFAIAIQKQEI